MTPKSLSVLAFIGCLIASSLAHEHHANLNHPLPNQPLPNQPLPTQPQPTQPTSPALTDAEWMAMPTVDELGPMGMMWVEMGEAWNKQLEKMGKCSGLVADGAPPSNPPPASMIGKPIVYLSPVEKEWLKMGKEFAKRLESSGMLPPGMLSGGGAGMGPGGMPFGGPGGMPFGGPGGMPGAGEVFVDPIMQHGAPLCPPGSHYHPDQNKCHVPMGMPQPGMGGMPFGGMDGGAPGAGHMFVDPIMKNGAPECPPGSHYHPDQNKCHLPAGGDAGLGPPMGDFGGMPPWMKMGPSPFGGDFEGPHGPHGTHGPHGVHSPHGQHDPRMGGPHMGGHHMGGHHMGEFPMGGHHMAGPPMGGHHKGGPPMGGPFMGGPPMGGPFMGGFPMGAPFNPIMGGPHMGHHEHPMGGRGERRGRGGRF